MVCNEEKYDLRVGFGAGMIIRVCFFSRTFSTVTKHFFVKIIEERFEGCLQDFEKTSDMFSMLDVSGVVSYCACM